MFTIVRDNGIHLPHLNFETLAEAESNARILNDNSHISSFRVRPSSVTEAVGPFVILSGDGVESYRRAKVYTDGLEAELDAESARWANPTEYHEVVPA